MSLTIQSHSVHGSRVFSYVVESFSLSTCNFWTDSIVDVETDLRKRTDKELMLGRLNSEFQKESMACE